MIRIRDLTLRPGESQSRLHALAAKALKLPPAEISYLEIHRRSLDARKKQDIRWIYTVDVAVRREEKKLISKLKNQKITLAEPYSYDIPKLEVTPAHRPVVVGFGPGGMFAALVLAEAGLRPIVLERGYDAKTRHQLVEAFWKTGKLDSKCNVQFGEGGAGTFSDGKLNTGTKNPRGQWVLSQFAAAGANPEILYDAKPHVGTDVLLTVVQVLRQRILELGGEVRFGHQVTALSLTQGRVTGLEVTQEADTYLLPCDRVILAIGHSARDTFETLLAQGVPMEPKPLSMGVRVEHPQALIDESQYGEAAKTGLLPPADYKLNVHLPDGTSAYTFCMCPGGQVVAAASEEGRVVTNGMSNAARDGENANAALLVTLQPEDFPDKSTLGGMYWQREIEARAFQAGGSNYHAPAQRLEDFLAQRPSTALGDVTPSYRPGVTLCDLHDVLPPRMTRVLEQAIPALDKKLHGYALPDAVLTAPETRSSSPVRILRNDSLESPISGLFPCGEGAGYAGGILSAAVDGMRCAEALVASLHRE